MKAYLFDTETGIYAGETFEEADMLHYEEGITTIVPPEYGHGEVAIFDRQCQAWEIIPVNIARQLLKAPTDVSRENES